MNFLKSIGTVLTTVLIITSLTACGSTETNVEDSKEPKKVVSGSNGETPPSIAAGQLTPQLEKQFENGRFLYKFSFKNDKEQKEVLKYSSSQQYEYQLIDHKGTVVYTYSMDKTFLQSLTEQVLMPGEIVTFEIELTEDLKKLQTGTYQFVVWSTATDKQELKAKAEINWGGEGEGLEEEVSTGKLAGAVVTYVGLMDQNSIEVLNENGDVDHFRLSDKVKPQFETLEPDTKITVHYGMTSEGQKIIEEVIVE
jgi:hypothetical protein